MQAIQDNRWIRLVEQPEYKRRWNREPWAKRQQRALRDWLLDHLEQAARAAGAELMTGAQLVDRVQSRDDPQQRFQQVAALYSGSDTFDPQALVVEKPSYWGLRGKLDVPKERFFSLPGCERPGDQTPVIGWAGLDHLQRAQAIAAWYVERKERDGWGADQLMPMLVALDELIPWLKQWHNALDPTYGTRTWSAIICGSSSACPDSRRRTG